MEHITGCPLPGSPVSLNFRNRLVDFVRRHHLAAGGIHFQNHRFDPVILLGPVELGLDHIHHVVARLVHRGSVMMPSTVITAIFCGSHCPRPRIRPASGQGRGLVVVAEAAIEPAPKLKARETNWVKLTSRLKASITNSMMDAIIQPRLLRGLAGGGVMIGGEVNGGGTPAGGKGGVSMSIASPD